MNNQQQTTKTSAESIRFVINWLFLCLIFVTPLVFSFKTSELFEFPKMMLVYGFTSVILALWLGRSILEKKFFFRATPLDIPIGLFLASQLLATIFSIQPHTSIFGYYGRFHGGLLSTVSYITLYYAFVNNLKKRFGQKMIFASLSSGFIIAVYAILEHFGHSFSCLLISHGQTFNDACWVQDVQHRVFATLGQPNWLAALMDMLIFFALYFVSLSRKIWQFLLWLIVSASLFLSLLYTGSRSGFLAVVIGSLFWFGLIIWSRQQQTSVKSLKLIDFRKLSLALFSLTLIAAVTGTPVTAGLQHFWRTEVKTLENKSPKRAPTKQINTNQNKPIITTGGTDSGVIREIVWRGAIKVWQRYPIFGSGVGTFGYSYYRDRPLAHNRVSEWNFLYNKAHNEFLNFLATSGIVGLAAYLILLGGFFRLGLIQLKQQQQPILISSMLAAILALSVSNFFGFSTVSVTLLMWLIFAYVAIIALDNQKTTSRHKPSLVPNSSQLAPLLPSPLIWWQYLMLTLVILVTFLNLAWVWRSYTADKNYKLGDRYFQSGKYQLGLRQLQTAIKKSPNEPLYQSKLSFDEAKLALMLAQNRQATPAAQFSQNALLLSENAIKLNQEQLNFYKTRARTLTVLSATASLLAQIDKAEQKAWQNQAATLLRSAVKTLQRARQLAPNEPSLTLDLAKINNALGKPTSARALFKETLKLKPDYGSALWSYGKFLEEEGQLIQAKQLYQQFLKEINPHDSAVQAQLKGIKLKIASQSARNQH